MFFSLALLSFEAYLYWYSFDWRGGRQDNSKICVDFRSRTFETFEKNVKDGGIEEKGDEMLSTFWQREMLTIHYYMTYVNAISKKSNFRNFFMISLHIGSTVSKLDFFLIFWSCRVYFVYCLRNVQFLKFKKSGIPICIYSIYSIYRICNTTNNMKLW